MQVAAEALVVCECTVQVIEASSTGALDAGTQAIVQQLFDATLDRLKGSDQDQEIKDNAIRYAPITGCNCKRLLSLVKVLRSSTAPLCMY